MDHPAKNATTARPPAADPPPPLEVVILAGGLSSRMGRDKSSLRLGRASVLTHIRRSASQLGLPVRVIRRDRVPRCGPLGGVYTALISTRCAAVIFLACDTPFLSRRIPDRVRASLRRRDRAVFTQDREGNLGMPFVLRADTVEEVTRLLAAGRFSLRGLALTLRARRLKVPRALAAELFNVNTPADWKAARQRWSTEAVPVPGKARPLAR